MPFILHLSNLIVVDHCGACEEWTTVVHIVNPTVIQHHQSMTRTDPQMKLRIPADLKDRVEQAAQASGRSMNAEILQRLSESFEVPGDVFLLQHELRNLREASPLHRLYVLLDSSGYPQSWAQIHEVARAICETGGLTAVEMSVTVVTPEMVSSSERYAEAAALATRLRAIGRSGDIDQMESGAVNNRVTTAIPAKGSKPSSKRRA